MGQTIRYCPDCGWDRLFEQPHPHPGSCADALDRVCPEWSCTECGAALLIEVSIGLAPVARAAEPDRRVA
jgi:hypothetical protein